MQGHHSHAVYIIIQCTYMDIRYSCRLTHKPNTFTSVACTKGKSNSSYISAVHAYTIQSKFFTDARLHKFSKSTHVPF